MTIDPETCVPNHTLPGLKMYRDDHIPTGGFLNAVLLGNQNLANQLADLTNRRHIACTFVWVEDHIPEEIRGSKEKITAHLAKRFAD